MGGVIHTLAFKINYDNLINKGGNPEESELSESTKMTLRRLFCLIFKYGDSYFLINKDFSGIFPVLIPSRIIFDVEGMIGSRAIAI